VNKIETQDESKQGIRESGPKSQEYRQVFVFDHAEQIVAHGAIWMLPVPESNPVVFRVTTLAKLHERSKCYFIN
jgi:hypothetical protein